MTLAEAVEKSCCVRVYSQEDAITLVNMMIENHPSQAKSWKVNNPRWDDYGENTVYYLDYRKSGMKFGDIERYDPENDGMYPLIEFDDLEDVSPNAVELVESEFSIDFLMKS